MPDTMLPTDASPVQTSASCDVMSGYRSPAIGKLVTARAKASAKIKAIVKAKKADIPSKTGGRGYQYAYADLADSGWRPIFVSRVPTLVRRFMGAR